MSYAQEFAAYRTQHPAGRSPDQHARNAGLDQLARHAPGTNQPSGKATYTPQGALLTMNIYEVLTTYQRDRQGRAQSRRMGAGAQRRGLVVTYTYCPNGLLANETEVQGNGPPRQVRRYCYPFY